VPQHPVRYRSPSRRSGAVADSVSVVILGYPGEYKELGFWRASGRGTTARDGLDWNDPTLANGADRAHRFYEEAVSQIVEREATLRAIRRRGVSTVQWLRPRGRFLYDKTGRPPAHR